MDDIRPELAPYRQEGERQPHHAAYPALAREIAEFDPAIGKPRLDMLAMLVRHQQHDLARPPPLRLQCQQFRQIAAGTTDDAVADVQDTHDTVVVAGYQTSTVPVMAMRRSSSRSIICRAARRPVTFLRSSSTA